MPSTTTGAKSILEYLLINGTKPAAWKIGLSTTLINTDGTGATNPAGNYSSISINANTWNTAENSEISNSSLIKFNKATSGWGLIKEIILFASAGGGENIYFHQPIIPPILVEEGTTVVIQPNSLVISRKIVHSERG